MWARTAAVAAFVVTALACGGASTGDVVVVPVPTPVAVPSPSVAEPAAAVIAVPDASDVVAAYVADCHHVFPAAVEHPEYEENDVTNECTWREFDQNCSPDPSGCWDKGQSCLDECGTTCSSCQDTCANACDSCKSVCNDDATCLRACAEGRSTCRDTCLGAKSSCADSTCPSVASECESTFEATKAEKCPNCAEIEACFMERWTANDWEATACHEKFADGNKECIDWCAPPP